MPSNPPIILSKREKELLQADKFSPYLKLNKRHTAINLSLIGDVKNVYSCPFCDICEHIPPTRQDVLFFCGLQGPVRFYQDELYIRILEPCLRSLPPKRLDEEATRELITSLEKRFPRT